MASPVVGCLFNLIIYTHNVERKNYFHELVNILINKFPCRVIFIEVEENDFQISRVEGIGKTEQITIKTNSKTLPQVPYSLSPILVPDLPVYLIWGENPTTDNLILPYLMKLATRIIYDSSCSNNLREFSSQILKNLDQVNIDFIDIDWALIRGWREIISLTFDSQEKLELAKNCDSIKITYSHFARRAVYLQAWIATQLGWKIVKQVNPTTIKYQNGSREVTVTLERKEEDSQTLGDILSVQFSSKNGNEITCTKTKGQSVVFVHITRGDVCELPFSLRLPNFQRGLGFIKEIFYFQTGSHYKNMLETLSKIDWKDL